MKPPILITVLLKPSARKEGTSVIIPHIAKGMPEREDHTNERKVVDRVVGLEWSLPVPFNRQDPRSMAHVFDAQCKNPRMKWKVKVKDKETGEERMEWRYFKNHFNFVVSAQPPTSDRYEEALELTRKVEEQLRRTFFPQLPWTRASHCEKNHPHTHSIIGRWDDVGKRTVDLDDIEYMRVIGMEWCTVPGVRCGAGIYEKSQSHSYGEGAKVNEFMDLILRPGRKPFEHMNETKAAGAFTPFRRDPAIQSLMPGDNGVVYKGKKIQLKAINHQLKVRGSSEGVGISLEGWYVPLPVAEPELGPVAQQSWLYAAMGVGVRYKNGALKVPLRRFESLMFDPDLSEMLVTSEQRQALADFRAGREPKDPYTVTVLSKLFNAHLVRRVEYGEQEPCGKNKELVAHVYYRNAVEWERQPHWLWSLTNDLSRAHAQTMGPHWEEFQRSCDAMDRMRRREKKQVIRMEEAIPL